MSNAFPARPRTIRFAGFSYVASLAMTYDGEIPRGEMEAARAADAAEFAALPPLPLPRPVEADRQARASAARIAAEIAEFEALPADRHGFRKWRGRWMRHEEFLREVAP